MSSSAVVTTQLERARARRSLIRMTRDIAGADRVEGFVVGVGRRWVLVSTPDDRLRPDGFTVVRRRDVEAVWRHSGGERVQRRSLRLQGAWPPAPAPLDLDTTSGLLASAARTFPLLSVFIERDDPDVCFIGRLAEPDGRRFVLEEISPRGRWEGVFRARPRRVTRLDLGGGYETALLAVAGPRPR